MNPHRNSSPRPTTKTASWKRWALTALTLTLALVTHAEAQRDASVERDLRELEAASAEAFGRLLGTDGEASRVSITYVGKGELTTNPAVPPTEVDDPKAGPPEALTSWSAFNPNTGNEFRIEIDSAVLRRLGDAAIRKGWHRAGQEAGVEPSADHGARPETQPKPTAPSRATQAAWPPPQDAPQPTVRLASWSNNSDDRQRRSSLTAATTSWPWRTISHFSNNCSGTLIGPRHVVTAAHCIYQRAANGNPAAWSSFTIRPGRAGGNWGLRPGGDAYGWKVQLVLHAVAVSSSAGAGGRPGTIRFRHPGHPRATGGPDFLDGLVARYLKLPAIHFDL